MLAVSAAAVSCAGCSSKFDIVPVSGRVTLDGQPLADAQISFQPVGGTNKDLETGPASYARSDASGNYTLLLVTTDEQGAVVGQHRVYVTTVSADEDAIDDAGGLQGEIVPARYRDGSFFYNVPSGGTDQANLELTTEAASP